jgi:PAS domain S-box-containing protein
MQTNENAGQATLGFLSGTGEMSQLIRSIDWSQTSLGPIETWPQSLRTTLSIMVHSKFPMFLFWGHDHIGFYNDAYRSSLGNSGKHPFAFGKKGEEAWPEIWPGIKVMIDQVLSGGEAMFRNGKMEDAFWTYCYSAVYGESGKPVGVFVSCTETTEELMHKAEQKKTAAALRKSRERFRKLADNAPVMIWVTDKEGYCTYLNKQWLDFTGQTLEEGKGMGWANALHPGDQEEATHDFMEASRNQRPFEKEYRLRKWDGTYEWVLDAAIPRLDEQGRFSGYIGSVVNIHRRKLAEQALLETNRRLDIATTAANVGVWSLDVKANKLDWTPLHKRMWGYDENSTSLTYEDWHKVILPGDKEKAFQKVDQALRLRSQYDAFYRIKRANDGVIRWMRSFGQYFYDDNGEPVTFTGVSIDITEQKLAEERIRESEARFRNLADQAPMWVWMADENAQNTYSNKELLRFLGLSHFSQLRDLGWHAFVHPKDIQTVNKALEKASKERKSAAAEFRVKNAASGRYEWFLVKVVPRFEDDKFFGFIGTALNIHQQKKQMAALAESEQRFRTLAETQSQLVWMTDEKGNQLYASSRWEAYAGFKPTGKNTWAQMIHPDDVEPTGKIWEHSLISGDVYKAELRLKNKNGEYRWHYVHGEPVKNEKGQVTRWIGSLTDIHDQKTLSQKLEEQVRKRTKELQRSNEDLQQFAHVASHDLKEPVRKIKTFVARLQEEISEKLDERAKTYIHRVLNAANRMVVMIDGVLSYSTISALEEMFEFVDLNEVMKSVEVDLELVIQQKGATIRYNNLPTIEGAPIILHQLFYNLVNNALKFTRPGVPPVITVTTQIESSNGLEFALIDVQDNGIGFEQEYADQIFGTFTRLHSKDRYEGSGLGLALCKNIVERHGGSIRAKGIPNQGATFEITLPVKR